jgi:hypothetical protein
MNYSKQFLVKTGRMVDLDMVDAGFKERHESHERLCRRSKPAAASCAACNT